MNAPALKKYAFLCLAVLAFGASCARQGSPAQSVNNSMETNYSSPLKVGEKTLNVEVVSSTKDLELGLSGRQPLAENEGMLFLFSKKNTTAFWMKDMKFGLDLIWIADGKIIGITKNVPAPSPATPTSELPSYYSPASFDTVLEVLSGWADRNGIKVGDEVGLK